MYPQPQSQGNFNPRFSNVANEVLRSSQSGLRPGYDMPPYGGMSQTTPMNQNFNQGYQPNPHGQSWQVGNLQNLYEIKKLQDEIDQDKEDEEKEVYSDNLIKIIDRQRGVLNDFLVGLTKNKEKLMSHQNKDMERDIRKLEKENIIRQIKINDEQAQLYRNLGAVYDFDPSPYQLSDVETDSDEEDDDILLEILSNKVYFQKIQNMMKAPKKKKKKKKKKTSNPAPTIPTDLSMSYAPGYDDSMMRTPGGAMTTKRKKKKTLPNYD